MADSRINHKIKIKKKINPKPDCYPNPKQTITEP